MVGVITGLGLGLEKGSGFVLGSRGQLGQSAFGRFGENVYVNAATGNLAIDRTDEILIGRGLDDSVTRSYNSLGTMSDDNGDNWQLGASRSVVGLSGTVNTAGSSVHRLDWDGSNVVYSWDSSKNAYVAKDGAGSYDTLTFASNVWTWTDGNSRVTETYLSANSYRLSSASDLDGNQLTYTYTGGLLTRVATANGERTDYSYSGNNLTQVATTLSDGSTLTRVRYGYDTSNRLSTVTTDLSPTDNAVSDGKTVVTTYGYDGSSKRVASISQTGGAQLTMSYVQVGSVYRVQSFTQTQASGTTDTTSFSYDTTNRITTITDPLGFVSKMTYDAAGQLTRLEQPAPQTGAATKVSNFGYNANGDVTTVTDGAGNGVSYGYDANGNATQQQDLAGNTITRTYGSKNELLTETRYLVPDPDNGGSASPSQPVTRRYAYDAKNHLRYTVDETGNVTEYQYDAYGRQISAIKYTGNSYSLSGLASGDAISETTLNNWRHTFIQGTALQITDTAYDPRGNVSTVTTYDQVNANRVHYGLFQSGTTGWTIGTLSNGMTAGPLATGTNSGLTYIKSSFTASAAGQTTSIATGGLNWFPVTGGERLAVRAGVEGTGAIGTLSLFVQWADANGNSLSGTAIGSFSGPQAFNSTIAGFVAPPAGATFARLELYATSSASGSGTFDITLPMVARASANQVDIPDFNAHVGNDADNSPSVLDGLGIHRTTYVYDQSGNLLSTHDNRTTTSNSYVYDGLGRVIASTDLGGNSTSVVYTDGSNTQVVITANGATTATAYDAAGEPISTTLNGSGVGALTTNYAYDIDGQMRMATDANGYRSYYLYDGDGNKSASITADGAMTEYRYDASNRLVATIQYATKLSSTQLSSLVDANGKPTNVTLASIRPAANSSTDRWTWNVYDRADRLIETINAVGSATVYAYDGASRLVSTKSYANYLSVANFQTTIPTTLQIPTTDSAHDRTTRLFYDDAGRQIGTLAADGSLTQTDYDSSGHKIRQIAYANFTEVTLRASGTMAQLVGVITPSGIDQRTDYVYDASGLLRYTIDVDGRPVGYSYDASGNVIRTTDYAARITKAASYSLSYVVGQIVALGLDGDSRNRISRSVYDVNGRVAFTIDAMGDVKGFVYDSVGNLTKQTGYATLYTGAGDPSLAAMQGLATTDNDRITRMLYDGYGRVVYTVDAENYVTETRYDHVSQVIRTLRYSATYSVTDTTTSAQLASTIGNPGDAAVTSYTYDTAGRLSEVTDPTSVITHYDYDAFGQAYFTRRAYGTSDASVFQRRFDAAGRVTSISDPADVGIEFTVIYGYDAVGNLKTVTDGRGNTTTNDYDNLGQLITSTDPLGGATHFTFNAFGDKVATTDPRGNTSYSYYDDLGQMILQVDPEGYATSTTYNFDGAVTSIIRYAARVSGSYAINTWPTINTGAADETTVLYLDKLDRIFKTLDSEGNYEQYTLDAFGNRTQVRNKLGGITVNTFDKRGQLKSETLPISSINNQGNSQAVVNTYEYDSRGNLQRKIEAAGFPEQRTTVYDYDQDDRLIQITHDAVLVLPSGTASLSTSTSKAPIEHMSYDKRGNLTQKQDAAGASTFYYYDLLDRKIAEISPTGTLSAWSYDLNGNVATATTYGDPVAIPTSAGGSPPSPANASNFRLTSYTYDNNNRLYDTKISGILHGVSGPPYVVSSTDIDIYNNYDASGNITQTVDAGGNSTYYFYDKAGHKVAEVDPLKYLTYFTLDNEGNVLTEERFASALTTTVDTASNPTTLRNNAIAGANHADDRVTTFTYDRNGRRLTESRQGVLAWTIDASGHPSSVTATATVSYTYNGLGQVKTKQEATLDTTTFTYDAIGRQIGVDGPAFVDYTGASVDQSVVNSYDGVNNLRSTAVNGQRTTTYTYGAGGRLSQVKDATGFITYYEYDIVGNVLRESYDRLLTTGTTRGEGHIYTYDAAGRQVTQSIARYVDSSSAWATTDPGTGQAYDYSSIQYNAYGDVATRGVNGTSVSFYQYDGAGRVWRATQADGTTQIYVYNARGYMTLSVASSGSDLSNQTVGGALNLLTGNGDHAVGDRAVAGIVATIYFIDPRGQTAKTAMPWRDLSANSQSTLSTSRTYNAFGEVASETDARGGVTNYVYNTEGKLTQSLAPTANWTAANGTIASARATQTNYYDVSGRLVGVMDANGNVNTLSLRAGTGYGGDDADVLKEFHADGGVFERKYDVLGDMRTTINEVGKTEAYVYDGEDRLIEQDHQVRAAGSTGNSGTSAVQLIDYYGYDGLGQRIRHWNNQLGASVKETTDYDAQGRITTMVDLGGDTTSYRYDLLTSGGNFTGRLLTTTNAAGRTQTENFDTLGRETSKTDFGGHQFNYSYDAASRLVETRRADTADDMKTTWFNTGLVASTSAGTLSGSTFTARAVSTYAYDANGNRTLEQYTVSNGSAMVSRENATVTWDAMNRMTSFADTGGTGGDAVTIGYEYDLAGNVRRMYDTYYQLDPQGNVTTAASPPQDYWYTYDAMNRFRTTMGQLSGTDANGAVQTGANARGFGTITRGYTGKDIQYDAAGERTIASSTHHITYDTGSGNNGDHSRTVDGLREEHYDYSADGYLATVRIIDQDYVYGQGVTPVGSPILRAGYLRDAMGRVTDYKEYGTDGTTVSYRRQTNSSDARGNVTSETVTSHPLSTTTAGATDTVVTNITNEYGAYNSATGHYDGTYQGGVVTHSSTTATLNGTAQPATDTVNSFVWWDNAVQSAIAYKPNASQSTVNTTTYAYDGFGHLSSVRIADQPATTRTIVYTTAADGTILQRDVNPDAGGNAPREYYYYFDGIRVGDISNDGTSDTDYVQSIAEHKLRQGPGIFRDGQTGGAYSANFDQSYDPINGLTYDSKASLYTVRAGDTLTSIAQAVWGDASLWYMLADVNGLDGTETLVAGQDLRIPNKVANLHNTSSTYRVYDPNEAIGNTSPTDPKPARHHHGNDCGVFGQILLVAVAVAVTYFTYGALTETGGLFAGATAGTAAGAEAGAIAGVAGSVASQGVGLATGIQDKFSFSGVALAAIGGGVGGAFGKGFGDIAGSQFLGHVATGVVSDVLTQGLALATGLQDNFSWGEVASAGLAAGVGKTTAPSFGETLARNTAGAIAGAAGRSLLTGTDFGDNILKALPSAIGQTIGNYAAQGIASIGAPKSGISVMSGYRSASILDGSIASLAGGGANAPMATFASNGTSASAQAGMMAASDAQAATQNAGDGQADEIVVTARRSGGMNDLQYANYEYADAISSRDADQGAMAKFHTWDVTTSYQAVLAAESSANPFSLTLSDQYSLAGSLMRLPPGWIHQGDNWSASSPSRASGSPVPIALIAGLTPGGALSMAGAQIFGADARTTNALVYGGMAANSVLVGLGGMQGSPAAQGLITADSVAVNPLRAGQLAEVEQLNTLGSGGRVSFTPTQAQIDSAAFKVIVGDAKYTAKGALVGTIYDASLETGLGEIKTGSSALDSSYQLRLQTYGSLVNNTSFTIYTSRPVNPTFDAWLTRWGVAVQPLRK